MGLDISWTAPAACIQFLHMVRMQESSALRECVRYGPKTRFWLRHLVQLPPLIYQESSCYKCLSQNLSLPHFPCLRRYDDDENKMDSFCCRRYNKTSATVGIAYSTKIIFIIFTYKKYQDSLFQQMGFCCTPDCGRCPRACCFFLVKRPALKQPALKQPALKQPALFGWRKAIS